MGLFKKFTTIFVVALVATSSIQTISPATASGVKAGSACAPAGASTTIKIGATLTKFTCTKNGKKLIWGKGIVVTGSTQTPTAPSALGLNNLDPKLMRPTAYEEVARELSSYKTFSPKFNYLIGANTPESRVAPEKAGLERAATFWSDVFQPNSVNVGYYTENDASWVDSAFCTGAGYCPGPGNGWFLISKQIEGNAPNCRSAQATFTPKGYFFEQCVGTGSSDLKNIQTGPHEYTHLAQYGSSTVIGVPNWWTEGSAAYFGGVLGAYDGEQVPADLDHITNVDAAGYVKQNLIKIDPKSTASIVAGFKFTYTTNNKGIPGSQYVLADVSYYCGELATEAMVALWGMKKIKHFMAALKSTSFDEAFKAEFGVTTDVFYNSVAKYVSTMYAAKR